MLLTTDHPEASKYTVWLNDRLVRTVVSADDEQGWIDIVDIEALTANPNDQEQIDVSCPQPWESIPVKRLYGKVEFKKISS